MYSTTKSASTHSVDRCVVRMKAMAKNLAAIGPLAHFLQVPSPARFLYNLIVNHSNVMYTFHWLKESYKHKKKKKTKRVFATRYGTNKCRFFFSCKIQFNLKLFTWNTKSGWSGIGITIRYVENVWKWWRRCSDMTTMTRRVIVKRRNDAMLGLNVASIHIWQNARMK